MIERWDESPDLAKFGLGYLLYGPLDYIVDGQFEAVQSLDDCMEELEDRLFDNVRGAWRSSGGASSCARAWCCSAGS